MPALWCHAGRELKDLQALHERGAPGDSRRLDSLASGVAVLLRTVHPGSASQGFSGEGALTAEPSGPLCWRR